MPTASRSTPLAARVVIATACSLVLLLLSAAPVLAQKTPPSRVPTLSPRAAARALSTRLVTAAMAQELALAMGIPAANLVSADLGTSDPQGVGVGATPIGRFFPRQGSTFAILSSGAAGDAELPNTTGGLSTTLAGLNNSQGNDAVQLRLVLRPPPGATCLSFEFAFYSEEFPEFVGSSFNDVFLAELRGSTFTISGSTITAPNNFAFDAAGNLVSVNTVLGVSSNTENTYDGSTPLVRATAALTAQDFPTVELVLTIMDLGDSILDSTVFLDNFAFLSTANCAAGGNLVEIQGVQVVGLGSIGVLGVLPNGASVNPVISGNAQFIAFESDAPNLAAALCGDPSGSGRSHVYRRSLSPFSPTVICISQVNPPGDASSTNPAISHDGDTVAWLSRSTNFTSTCMDGQLHVFVKQVIANTIQCLTAGANGPSGNPAVSADGNVVVFDTQATTLICGNFVGTIVHANLGTGTQTCLSPGAGGSADPAVDEDGSFVAFQTLATTLGCAGPNQSVVRRTPFGGTTCIANGNAASGQADISDDGQTVAFASLATNLDVPACQNIGGNQQIYVWKNSVARCFSLALNGAPGDGPTSDPALSGDGGAIAFSTRAGNIIPPSAQPGGPFPAVAGGVVAQALDLAQVIRRSTAAATSIAQLISSAQSATANGSSTRPTLDFSGSVTAFQSQATNLVSGDTNGNSDIFIGNEEAPPPTGRVVLFTPATGSLFPLTSTTTIVVGWTGLSGVNNYGLEVSAPNRQFINPNGTGPDPINGFGGAGLGFMVSGTSQPFTLPPGSVPPGTYNLRVIPLGVAGATFSNTVGVTVGPIPPSGPFNPTITSPTTGDTFSIGDTINFAWEAVPGAPLYLLAFTGPVSGSAPPINVTGFPAFIAPGFPTGTFQVTVQALDGAGTPLGPPSTAITVTITP